MEHTHIKWLTNKHQPFLKLGCMRPIVDWFEEKPIIIDLTGHLLWLDDDKSFEFIEGESAEEHDYIDDDIFWDK